jgi:CheY-like chemotaxis protein
MTDHRHSLLLVEDDAEIREPATALLEDTGYNVLNVSHGRQALAALRGGFRPCAILLDLAMPEMDGLEFRRHQLADSELAAIPVVVVSSGGYDREMGARQLGLTTFLRKPMDLNACIAAVHRACARLT